MYFDEDTVLDVRLNYLNNYVDKFVIIEAEYNHKGEKRKPKFNIKNFHSAVLDYGNPPLFIVEEKIDEMIANSLGVN